MLSLKDYYRCTNVGMLLDAAPGPAGKIQASLADVLMTWGGVHGYAVDVALTALTDLARFFAENQVVLLVVGPSVSGACERLLAEAAGRLRDEPLLDAPTLEGETVVQRLFWGQRKVGVVGPDPAAPEVLERCIDLGCYPLGCEAATDDRDVVDAVRRLLAGLLRLPRAADRATSDEAARHLAADEVAAFLERTPAARRANRTIYGPNAFAPRRLLKNRPFFGPPTARPAASAGDEWGVGAELARSRPYRNAVFQGLGERRIEMFVDPVSGARLPIAARRPATAIAPSITAAQRQFRSQGFCVVPGLFDVPFLHNEVFGYFAELARLNRVDHEHDLVIRDDHVARYINAELTAFATRIVGEPLTTIEASNVNWYESGDGFGAHFDGSPAFDVSLVIALGPATVRHGVTLVSRSPEGAIAETAIACSAGDGLLFAGSEILHFGTPFDAHESHCVMVLAWTYVRR